MTWWGERAVFLFYYHTILKDIKVNQLYMIYWNCTRCRINSKGSEGLSFLVESYTTQIQARSSWEKWVCSRMSIAPASYKRRFDSCRRTDSRLIFLNCSWLEFELCMIPLETKTHPLKTIDNQAIYLIIDRFVINNGIWKGKIQVLLADYGKILKSHMLI